MMSRQLTILILLTIYVLTAIGLTVYHAYNFSDYVHRKGDETMNYTFYLLLTSVVFQGLLYIVTKTFDWKATFLATVVNFIISFIIGFGILMLSGLSGIPRHMIFVYGGCYLTFFTIVTILHANRLGTKAQ
jgi:hypothetical protein